MGKLEYQKPQLIKTNDESVNGNCTNTGSGDTAGCNVGNGAGGASCFTGNVLTAGGCMTGNGV